jgi:carboxypeptidase C (cathepsin A)
MGLDPSLQKNITFGHYDDGHMIYIHTPALKKLKADLARFYDSATSD